MKIEAYGKQENPSILCVPGLFMSGNCFSRLVEQLPDYHVVCVTLDRHHPGGNEFDGLNEELDALVHALQRAGYTEFDLCLGLSLGTIVSLELANRPELRIKKLWLDGAVNLYVPTHPFWEQRAMSMIFGYFMRASKKPKKGKRVPRMGQIYSEDWSRSMQQCMACMSRRSKDIIVQVLSNYTVRSGVRQPLYFLYGEKENNLQVNCDAIKACYPDAEIVVKDGHTHLTYLDHEPAAYARMVTAFLSA